MWLVVAAPAQDTKKLEPHYSPYVDRGYPTRVYWGDQHLHTSYSPDAGMVGARHGPDGAYRFARGEQLRTSTGQVVQLYRPYDWLVVSDHAEYLGLPQGFLEANPDILSTPAGKRWAAALKKGGKEAYETFVEMTADMAKAKPTLPPSAVTKLTRTTWENSIAAADRNNKPGTFTAFSGFEWTQSLTGNNLHRIVVFRDGADKTKQVVPFSEFDSADPMDLWKYMADYEAKTGGRVMAIVHNSNLSCGKMFEPKTWTGNALDKKYAALRARFEPLAEISQSKGDSETTPQLSPTDEFANFERWNKANIFGLVATTPEMLPFNYCRSGLKLGLEQEAKLGVNPFKFGFIGGSDSHTSLSTTRAESYFGVGVVAEPKPDRWKEPFLRSKVSPKLDTFMWEMAPGGLGGVWAKENTREAIWDAMARREVYCTTGTRPVVRVFAGWDFDAKDLDQPDPVWVKQGYAQGVPMGGDLTKAPKGKSPTFMVKAMCDPDGAYLDRIQIVKGWYDTGGKLHEKVIDVGWSGDRKRDEQGKVPLVGSTVDVKKATWSNSIGAPVLTAFWRDNDFDPSGRAFYYVRVIEIPTPRWTSYDAARFGVAMPDYVPMTVTNRAYTSPVWYTPGS
jgi:hypothetical protein